MHINISIYMHLWYTLENAHYKNYLILKLKFILVAMSVSLILIKAIL